LDVGDLAQPKNDRWKVPFQLVAGDHVADDASHVSREGSRGSRTLYGSTRG
jgi:hypothetical protein